jgi:pyrroloquinoline quinone biosynthesis protein B
MHWMALQHTSMLLFLTSWLLYYSPGVPGHTQQITKTCSTPNVSLVVLGTVQDGGSPHIACKKGCCKDLFENPDPRRKVVSLGVIDHQNEKSYIFEATPDFPEQMRMLENFRGFAGSETPDGIFLTHAHIGHYTGLMFLGKEAMDAERVPVYAMPRMQTFLEQHGPWGQLVTRENIVIEPMSAGYPVRLTTNLSVTPLPVPHRDEYSETVGYLISGPAKTVLFIPDIDKWEKWDQDIVQLIASVDYAFVDATFYAGEEINARDITEIPHPFVTESMKLFESMSDSDRGKVHFIHFNHTNALLDSTSVESAAVRQNGFHIASIGDVFEL